MNKELKYKELVNQRKQCFDCKQYKFTNQSETLYDTESIGKWSGWQGNLDARILVIGQDWGSLEYWEKHKGQDSKNNRTNNTLRELFRIIGIEIGTYEDPNLSARVFFTNTVLCLKAGSMNETVRKQCFKKCSEKFLNPLIDLIKPEIIVTLGTSAYESVIELSSTQDRKINREPLRNIVRKNPIILNESGLVLFPFFHCGGLGLANRIISEQIEDWKFLKTYLENKKTEKKEIKNSFMSRV